MLQYPKQAASGKKCTQTHRAFPQWKHFITAKDQAVCWLKTGPNGTQVTMCWPAHADIATPHPKINWGRQHWMKNHRGSEKELTRVAVRWRWREQHLGNHGNNNGTDSQHQNHIMWRYLWRQKIGYHFCIGWPNNMWCFALQKLKIKYK